MIKTTKNTFEVLNVLFTGKFSINQIARNIGISVMGASKIVKKLQEENVVNIEKIGRSHIISLNILEPNIEVFSLAERYGFEKFLERNPALSGFLLKVRELKTDFSLIFGSYASGEESTDSDLDVMFVTSNKKIYKEINSLRSLLNIELYPLRVTRSEFVDKVKNNHRIYKEIIGGKRVIINGAHNFWSLMTR